MKKKFRKNSLLIFLFMPIPEKERMRKIEKEKNREREKEKKRNRETEKKRERERYVNPSTDSGWS